MRRWKDSTEVDVKEVDWKGFDKGGLLWTRLGAFCLREIRGSSWRDGELLGCHEGPCWSQMTVSTPLTFYVVVLMFNNVVLVTQWTSCKCVQRSEEFAFSYYVFILIFARHGSHRML
jgi:hypothetical protein